MNGRFRAAKTKNVDLDIMPREVFNAIDSIHEIIKPIKSDVSPKKLEIEPDN